MYGNGKIVSLSHGPTGRANLLDIQTRQTDTLLIGARLNLLAEPGDRNRVVYVAQTIKSGPARNASYKIDHRNDGAAKETFVPYDDDAALLKAIRDAMNGSL